jgi:hypothetical protein
MPRTIALYGTVRGTNAFHRRVHTVHVGSSKPEEAASRRARKKLSGRLGCAGTQSVIRKFSRRCSCFTHALLLAPGLHGLSSRFTTTASRPQSE